MHELSTVVCSLQPEDEERVGGPSRPGGRLQHSHQDLRVVLQTHLSPRGEI